MSLKDFQIRREPVEYRGVSVHVRGIALVDINFLMRRHLSEMNTLFAMYSKEETRDTAIAQSVAFASKIVGEMPELAAHLIMLAADEPVDDADTLEHVQKFPIGLQVELIRKVIALTFEEAGGAKKFIDSLVGTIQNLRPRTKTGD